MDTQKSRALITGVSLIALGLAVYYLQNAEVGLGRAGHLIIFFGGLSLIGYFWSKQDPLLFLGCILLSLGIGSIGKHSILDWDRADLVPIGLGFIAITVVKWLYERQNTLWPLIPGILMVMAGYQFLRRWYELVVDNWPLVVVVLGLLVVVSAFLKDDKGEAASGS